MPNARVVQNKGVASFVKALDMKKVLAHQSDEPLARFTITRFPRAGSTVIGFSQYHPIGKIKTSSPPHLVLNDHVQVTAIR